METEGTHTTGFIGWEFDKRLTARTQLSRIGQPQDIADAALPLASDESGWINGQLITAAGGSR
jgi:3-oxoacyl-[acyl-carrier protein] reductase